ncbi:hypothetical protein KTH44_09675 [Acinetobacter bereziniae]|uniref:hypothetical protein n=1 Tax=Acinetobacter bereziniae TaxID=106648 RepID=UPI0021CD86C3|nr:hypothetical protein [Acinetobacter bereziniae]MCU4319396.1 hypothetical protein [Acinetobacter bereziniae]
MNEFFLASNRSIYVHDLELKQITVKDLDQWSQFAEIIRKDLNNDYSKENIESIVKQHIVSALMLCSFSTIYDVKYFSDLMNNEADVFLDIFRNVLNVNKAYFDQEDSKSQNNKSENTWFDSFQFLISKGHRHKDILDYSFGTFIEYLKAAQRNERNSILSFSGAMRVSYHADAKRFEKYNKEMKSV